MTLVCHPRPLLIFFGNNQLWWLCKKS